MYYNTGLGSCVLICVIYSSALLMLQEMLSPHAMKRMMALDWSLDPRNISGRVLLDKGKYVWSKTKQWMASKAVAQTKQEIDTLIEIRYSY